jgi:uncharacterized protein
MSTELLVALAASIFVVATLYSSVGHAGASGYIAVMSLFSLAPASIKPTALVLNILVASLASWQFARAGHLSLRRVWPFALLAVPMAFLGGYLTLPIAAFKLLLGAVLLYSALHFLLFKPSEREIKAAPLWLALLCGAVIGLLSGLTGTGGGIFLSPLLLLMGWAGTKETAATSALFILLNSSAGLLGNLASTALLPSFIWPLVACAAVGGFIGSRLGSNKASAVLIRRLLSAVLLIAGGKLLLT